MFTLQQIDQTMENEEPLGQIQINHSLKTVPEHLKRRPTDGCNKCSPVCVYQLKMTDCFLVNGRPCFKLTHLNLTQIQESQLV